MKAMYTVAEVAERWDVSEYTVRKMIKEGALASADLPVLRISLDAIRAVELKGVYDMAAADVAAMSEEIARLQEENKRLKGWRSQVVQAVQAEGSV